MSEDIINCYNVPYRKGQTAIPQCIDTITLIPKEDSDLLLRTNCRPITVKIAVNDKSLFRRIENNHTQETSSLTREVRDDKGEKTTEETTRGRKQGI